jgi:hypothetical protein
MYIHIRHSLFNSLEYLGGFLLLGPACTLRGGDLSAGCCAKYTAGLAVGGACRTAWTARTTLDYRTGQQFFRLLQARNFPVNFCYYVQNAH